MITYSQWIYKTLQNLYNVKCNKSHYIKDHSCFLCGGNTVNHGLTVKEAITSKFTNYEFVVNKKSDSICESCSFILKQPLYYENKNKISKLSFRTTSWLISSAYSYPKLKVVNDDTYIYDLSNNSIIRDFILDKNKKEFIIICTTMGRKHIFLKGNRINNNLDNFEIIFENSLILTNIDEILMLIDLIESLLALGLTKTNIYTNNIYIKDIPLLYCYQIIDIINNYKNNPLFEFCIQISLNKGENTTWKTYKKLMKMI